MEGALPKEAGANFTWDSVHVNLRSVFGDGGWVRRRGDLRGGTAEESGRERGRNWKQSKKSKKVRGEVRGGKTKENYCLETCFKYHRRGMLCTKRGSHGMNASLFGQDRSSTAAKCQLMIKCVCGGRFGGKHCGFYGGFLEGGWMIMCPSPPEAAV